MKPRFGAIGQHGSIAIIERFFLSLKNECFRRIETRARYPLPGTGPPARRLKGELKLVITYQVGREHLPSVEINEITEITDERKAA